jgi:alpha-ketoglutaric semialdehyde dehydrogenase
VTPPSTSALLLVDLQRDYLDRPGLVPAEPELIAEVSALLSAFRAAGAPVVHIRTAVSADLSDAMPHWRDAGTRACIEGTAGAAPPESLIEHEGELVARKQHYRGFADPRLDPWLRERSVGRVVIAGLYTHACVRETALDAYERGYDVVIAADAVASNDPDHADRTHAWLDGRAARFVCVAEIAGTLAEGTAPAAHGTSAVAAASARAERAQGPWSRVSAPDRAAVLDAWAAVLERDSDELTTCIVDEVRKPMAAARDEVRRAIAHVRGAAALLRSGVAADESLEDGVVVRHRPVGVVGILMPWNNPLALPCGKIAPALAFGNAVVFKPAPEGRRTAGLILRTLHEAGAPDGLVEQVDGGPSVGGDIVDDARISAIAVTGSIATGRSIARRCTARGIRLQAELGGNNAAILLADADLDVVVPALVRNAFAFAGQRCTAVRRLIVARADVADVEQRLVAAMAGLVVGDAMQEATDVGPLISREARDRVGGIVGRAVVDGAVLLAGGHVPDGLAYGDWYAPTLLRVDDPESSVVQEETFGPVLVIQPATTVDEAIALANGVEQGLLMAVLTSDDDLRRRIIDAAVVGLVQTGPGIVPVHPDAPFGGWKASGVGPPEHGRWDADFLTRPQAVYQTDRT